MLALLLAAALASPAPPANSLNEAAHAIAADRLDQARAMITNAVAAGATGAPVERLLAERDPGLDVPSLVRSLTGGR